MDINPPLGASFVYFIILVEAGANFFSSTSGYLASSFFSSASGDLTSSSSLVFSSASFFYSLGLAITSLVLVFTSSDKNQMFLP